MRRYILSPVVFLIINFWGTSNLSAGEHTSLGISIEKSAILANQIDGINYTKLSFSKSKWEKVSVQISLGLGTSNDLNKSKLGEIINGRIRAFELDLSLRRHFFNPDNPVDYYLVLGCNIEVLYWKYRETFEVVNGDGYIDYEDKDGTTGLGFYCGVGMASFVLGDLKLSLESQPGIVFIPKYTNLEFDSLLNNMYYLKFNFSIVYDPK